MRKVIGKIKYRHSIPRKFNYILPGICGLALLLIGWMVINPIEMADEGFAIENSVDANDNTKATASIGIAWTNPSNLERETNGQSGGVTYRYDTFTLSASKIKQYQIFVNAATGSSGQLEGYLDADRTIPIGNIGGISNADGVIGKDMEANEWGYAVSEGYKTNDAELEQLTYKAVPVASSTTAAFTGTEDTLTDKQFTVAFGANVGSDKPAGHYTAYVTVSAVMEPKPLIESITYMQEITPDICADMPEADTLGNGQYQLTDKRDDKIYWIAKLKDGNCWMTQNLDLDLWVYDDDSDTIGHGRMLTSEDSDLLQGTDWISLSGKSTISFGGSTNTPNVIRYYDPGQYYCSNNTTDSCNLLTTLNDGHDAQGNYYSWVSAKAGGTLSQADTSICPRAWRLPTGGIDSEFAVLIDTLSSEEQALEILAPPYYFTRSGGIFNGATYNLGFGGSYWSSTMDQHLNAMHLFFYSNDNVSNNHSERYRGFSVRCVAR